MKMKIQWWLDLCLAVCLTSCIALPVTPIAARPTLATGLVQDVTTPVTIQPVITQPAATQPAVVSANPTTFTSQVTQAGGLAVVVTGLHLLDYHPDRDRLAVDVCYQRPDNLDWLLGPAELSFGSHHLTQTSGEGPVLSPGLESIVPNAQCERLFFTVPIQADLNDFQLNIKIITSQPTFEQQCGEVTAESQRILDQQHPGVIIDCRLTELGYETWVAFKPESMQLKEAQADYQKALDQALLELFAIQGPWRFDFKQVQIPRQPFHALLNPNERPQAPNLKFTISDISRKTDKLAAQVCFNLPEERAWLISDAVLQVGDSESYPTSFDLIRADAAMRCQRLSFDISNETDLSGAVINIYAITPPSIIEASQCPEYVARLNLALEKRGYGVKAACDVQNWGWQIIATDKPASMSEQEAEELIHTDEFTAVKGLWSLPVTLAQ